LSAVTPHSGRRITNLTQTKNDPIIVPKQFEILKKGSKVSMDELGGFLPFGIFPEKLS